MKKKIILQFFLILIVLISIFTFFNNYMSGDKNLVYTDIEKNKTDESNVIEGIEYFSKDINGNIYIIKATNGLMVTEEIENEEKQNKIHLFDVSATINFDQKEEIQIFSDEAIYNNDNYDTEFMKNVKVAYKNHKLSCKNLLAKFSENYAILSGNLVYSDLLTKLYADQMEIDLISRSSKTSMYNKEKKVKITRISDGIN